MNKKRREQIKAVISTLSDCKENLSDIQYDEDEARDNMPENLQESEAYQYSEECSDTLDEAISDIEEVIDNLDNI